MKNILLSISLVVPLVIASYSKSINDNNPEVTQKFIDKSLNFSNGELVEKKQREEDYDDAWKIKI
jgi:hypothetical protein